VAKKSIPDVEQTDLSRGELEEVAEELEVDAEGLSDQELLEQLGVALGMVDPDDIGSSPGGAGGSGAGSDEQGTDDEALENMTRDELREQLRARDLPVSGNKAELRKRLVEADEDGS
jgi:hypothetical protein